MCFVLFFGGLSVRCFLVIVVGEVGDIGFFEVVFFGFFFWCFRKSKLGG